MSHPRRYHLDQTRKPNRYSVESISTSDKLKLAQKKIAEANKLIRLVNRENAKTNINKDARAIEKGIKRLTSSSSQTNQSINKLGKIFKVNVSPKVEAQQKSKPSNWQAINKPKTKEKTRSRKRVFRGQQPGTIADILSDIIDDYSHDLEPNANEYLAVVFDRSYGRTIFSSLDKLENYIDDLRSDQTLHPKKFVHIEKIKAGTTKQALEKIESKNKSFVAERKEKVEESKKKLEQATGRKIKGRSIARTFESLADQFAEEKHRRVAAEKELAKLRKMLEKNK